MLYYSKANHSFMQCYSGSYKLLTTKLLHSLVYLLLDLKLKPPCLLCPWHSVLLCTAFLVYRRLPVVKHVAKGTPGGVVWRDKRGAIEQKTHRKTECCPPDILSLSSILLSRILLLLGPHSKRCQSFNYTHS